jgi:hypothetical protein
MGMLGLERRAKEIPDLARAFQAAAREEGASDDR